MLLYSGRFLLTIGVVELPTTLPSSSTCVWISPLTVTGVPLCSKKT